MAENLILGTLDHSKMLFWHFWMIPHDLVVLPNVRKHKGLSLYAVLSQSINPKSRKPHFWHFWITLDELLRFLNVVTHLFLSSWAISAPNCFQHQVLSRYAMWSPSDQPNPRNWHKTERIIQKFLYVSYEKKTLKINKDFPGHAVFAGNSKKVWIFILSH